MVAQCRHLSWVHCICRLAAVTAASPSQRLLFTAGALPSDPALCPRTRCALASTTSAIVSAYVFICSYLNIAPPAEAEGA